MFVLCFCEEQLSASDFVSLCIHRQLNYISNLSALHTRTAVIDCILLWSVYCVIYLFYSIELAALICFVILHLFFAFYFLTIDDYTND